MGDNDNLRFIPSRLQKLEWELVEEIDLHQQLGLKIFRREFSSALVLDFGLLGHE
jgi:hypothetical protein